MNHSIVFRTALAIGACAALAGCVVPPVGEGYGYPYGGVGYSETIVVPPPAYGYGGYGAYGGDFFYPRSYYPGPVYARPGYYPPRPGFGGGHPHDRGHPPHAGDHRHAPPPMAPPNGQRPDAAAGARPPRPVFRAPPSAGGR